MKAPFKVIYIATAASQAAVLAAQPASVVEMPPPPPPPVMVSRSMASEDYANRQLAMQQIVTLDVEVIGDKEELWKGSLRLNASQSGDYQVTKRQAVEACPAEADTQARYWNAQNQLHVTINRRSSNNSTDNFQITTNWQRPRPECDSGGGQRTVAFTQGFALLPGETKVLTGDAGLTVRVTRRR